MDRYPRMPNDSGYESERPNLEANLLEVRVTGQDPGRWQKLREKLIAKIMAILNTQLDSARESSVGDELKQFTSALLDFAKAKLAMPVAEVQRIGAEIATRYAEEQERLANAEKTREEARGLRIANDVREFEVHLGLLKAMLIGEPGDEALLFGNQIDALLIALKDANRPSTGLAIVSE